MPENQQFTTIDTVSVLGLILVVLAIITATSAKEFTDWRDKEALEKASQLAAQLVSNKVAVDFGKDGETGRKLASETQLRVNDSGLIGLDPWGKPYNYAVLKDDKNRKTAIVLSNGPNQKRETYEEHIVYDSSKALFTVKKQGDDIYSTRKGSN